MNTYMKELIEYIAKSIVSQPDSVNVVEEESDGRTLIKLQVAPEDKGKVIGRHGRMAQPIRSLLRVAAVKQNTRAMLDIE